MQYYLYIWLRVSFLAAVMFGIVTDMQAKEREIKIEWRGDKVKVDSPLPDSLTVEVDGTNVSITNDYCARTFSFLLTGKSDNGSFSYKGKHKSLFTLKDLTLNSKDRVPLRLRNSKKSLLKLKNTNRLTVDADTLDAAMISSKGTLQIEGKGTLHLASSAVGCKGIKVGKDLVMEGGNVHIVTSGNYVEVDTTNHFGPMGGPPPGMFDGKMPDFPAPLPGGGDFQFPPMGEGGGFPFPPMGDEGGFSFPPMGEGGGFSFPPMGDEGGFSFPPMGEMGDFAGFPGKQKYNGSTKGIRVKRDIIINGGELHIHTSAPGAEGLEGKRDVTINGGELHIDAYDDGINAGNTIAFRGGVVRVVSRHNDAVDSNAKQGGTIEITGGDTEAVSLQGSPEEGFDCDFSPILVTGGRAIGIGGAIGPNPSRPNEQTALQPTLILHTRPLQQGECLRVVAADGKEILTYTAQENIRDAHLLITSPFLVLNQRYQLEIADEIIEVFTLDSNVKK